MTCEDTDDIVLELIGILIFIDHEVLESPMEILSYILDIEDLAKEKEEIIEIESILFPHLSYICLIDF